MNRRPLRAADERDPHLRLPRALRLARAALMVFLVVTCYFALSLPGGGSDAERMVRARLVFEAFAVLVLLLALPRRPVPARIGAMALAVFVLVGCVPGLVMAAPHLPGASSAGWLGYLLALAACGSQAFVLGACLSVRGGELAAP